MIVLAPLLLSLAASPAGPSAPPLPSMRDDPPTRDDEDVIDQAELERLTETIRREIEAIRNLTFRTPVAVAVTDRDGFQAYAKRRLEETTSPEEITSLEVSAKLLGMLPVDMDYLAAMLRLMEEQVGGFYDPGDDKFYLMSTFTGGIARIILSHELTHALDDQHFEIDSQLEACKGDADAAFAFQAVVEGSGTSVMNRWTVQHMSELDASDLMKAGQSGQEEMAQAPPFLWKPLLCVYLRGAAFLGRTDNVMKAQMTLPEMGDVDRAFREPPRSSEQILHPEKYWDPARVDPPIAIRARGEELPGGWRRAYDDTLGEIGFALLLEDPSERDGLEPGLGALRARYTGPASEGWGGDRFVLLARGDDRAVVSYSVWDTDADAAEALRALTDLSGHLNHAARDYAATRPADEGPSGFLVRRGPLPRSVLAISAAGADPATLEPLVDALAFELVATQPK